MMQQNREKKQKFLVQQIIDKGYDPEDFQQYLFDNNGSQVNLDSWDLENLKKIVYQYQESKKQKTQAMGSSQQKIQKIQADIIKQKGSVSNITSIEKRKQQEVKQESEQYLQINSQTKQQLFSQVIECIQIPPNQMLNKQVQIKISKYIKKQGGIFQHSYYTYVVETPILGKVVQRRYNDFLWLKQTLQFHHPGLPIPPISKKGQFRRSDDKHLNKRRMILQMFLNELLQIPQIKAQQIFQNFLKFTDIVMFQKFKSDYKRTNNVPLTKVKNIKGKISAVIDPKINSFLVKSQRHIFQIQPMTKQIYKDFKGAATSLQQCAKTLEGVSQLCRVLNQKDEHFRKQTQIKYCSSNIYTILMQSSSRFAELLNKQAKIFRTQIYSSVKYQSLNLLNILESFDKLKAFQQEYIDTKNVLSKKKQKLYEQGIMTKWAMNSVPSQKPEKLQAIKMMLPKETKDLQKLRISYGIRNFQMFQQLNRYFTKNHQYLAKFIINYSKLQSQIASQLMMVWVDAQTEALGMKEGKSIKIV